MALTEMWVPFFICNATQNATQKEKSPYFRDFNRAGKGT
jgi:hypothetical protein